MGLIGSPVFGGLALVHPSNRRVGRVRASRTTRTLAGRDFDSVRTIHPAVDRFLAAVLAEQVVRTSALAVELMLPPETRLAPRRARRGVRRRAAGDDAGRAR